MHIFKKNKGAEMWCVWFVSADETEDEETEREEEEEHAGLFAQNPTLPAVGLAPSREPLQPSVEEEEPGDKGGKDL